MPEEVLFAGKTFTVPDPRHTAVLPGQLGYEKRDLIRLLGEHLSPDFTVLDAYAGVGIGTYLYLRAGASCLAVEKDAEMFACLERNLRGERAVLREQDNRRTLEELLGRGAAFDVIDLDAPGDFHEQLAMSFRLMDSGYLWLTTCEYVHIQRNLNRSTLERRYGAGIEELYLTRDRYAFQEMVSRHVEAIGSTAGHEVQLVHHAIGRTAVRLLFSVDTTVPRGLTDELSARERYFGPRRTGQAPS